MTLFQKNISVKKLSCLTRILMLIICGCTYYREIPVDLSRNQSKTVISGRVTNPEAYCFVLHLGNDYWKIENIRLLQDSFSGTLVKLDDKHDYYYRQLKPGRNHRFPKSDRYFVYQVHLFPDVIKRSGERVTVSYNDISNIDIMSVNKGLSALTKVGTGLLISGAAVVTFLAIVCGCPHAYTFDGEQYHYNNTLFTGSISPNTERHDYKSLPDYVPTSSSYQLIIKNEEQEHQYTNLLELISIEHDKDVEVYGDRQGRFYSIKQPLAPSNVVTNTGANITALLTAGDEAAYSFNETVDHELPEIKATFNSVPSDSDVRLIIRAKNTQWSGLFFKNFSSLFGSHYDEWAKHNMNKSRSEFYAQAISNGIPMLVSVNSEGKWIDIDTLDLVGDVDYATMIVPMKKEFCTNGHLEVRLRSGYCFWDVDYIAIDSSTQRELHLVKCPATILSGNGGTTSTIASSLSSDDNNYLEHSSSGDSVLIRFNDLPTSTDRSRTLVLHSKGYYVPSESPEGNLQLVKLLKLRKPGALSMYSEELYEKYAIYFAIR